MAGNPFDDFDAPQANPFDAFDAPKPAAGAQDLGSTAFWNKPANVGWGDYLLAHVMKQGQGADQAAQDYSRAAADDITFGLADRLQSSLTGNDLAQERALTQQAHSRLGAMDYVTAGAMYGLGPGELGLASRLGEAAAPYLGPLAKSTVAGVAPVAGKFGSWAGGVAGSAVEGALAGGAGAAGHGEDIGQGALMGGATGGVGGLAGGVVGRGGKAATPLSEDALRARATQEYAPLDEIVFHGPSQVKPALDAVANTMTGAEQDLAKSTMAKVNKLGDQNLATGSDIQSYQKLFGGLAKTGSDEDRQFAPKFKSALEGVMNNADPYGRNLTPGQGMSLMLPGPLGGTGLAAGDAAAARDAGDVFHGRANDIQRLNEWIDRSQVKGGPDVGDQARSYLLSKGTYAKAGTPGYEAINTLAGTGAGQDVSAAPSAWDLRHGVHPLVAPLLGGALVGAGGQAAQGHFDPTTLAAESAAGMVLGYGLHKGVPAFQSKFIQGPGQQRAIEAARAALSTGQAQAPVLPDAAFRDAVRKLIYGQGAAGAF